MRIGIDLGGTKIEALALSADGQELRRIRVPTPIFNATKGIYIKAMKSGLGGRDTAAVCAVLEKMAKVRRRKR